MSARKKVQGNAAVWCDHAGCEAYAMASSWHANAAAARSEARLYRGWTQAVHFGAEGEPNVYRRDYCPEHNPGPGIIHGKGATA